MSWRPQRPSVRKPIRFGHCARAYPLRASPDFRRASLELVLSLNSVVNLPSLVLYPGFYEPNDGSLYTMSR
jgi:hypothetical protein